MKTTFSIFASRDLNLHNKVREPFCTGVNDWFIDCNEPTPALPFQILTSTFVSKNLRFSNSSTNFLIMKSIISVKTLPFFKCIKALVCFIKLCDDTRLQTAIACKMSVIGSDALMRKP
jgi:hypothetical protein